MIFGIDNPEFAPHTALIDVASNSRVTYGELVSLITEFSRGLSSRKSLVFNFTRNTLSSVVSYLAALDSGHAVALLDATLTPELMQPLFDLYQPEVVVSPSPQIAGNSQLRGDLHSELSLLLSTSGTTGSPKFVRLTRGNIEANTESICAALDIQPDDRAITSLPIHYSYGLSVLNTHLHRGASVVLTDEGLMSAGFWDAFRSFDCTSFAGVPYSYQILRRLRPETLRIPTLRTMTQAGGKLHDDLVAEFHHFMASRSGRFFVMYGQTEASARICILPTKSLPEKLGSAGIPIPGGEVQISINGTYTREPGITGELIYNGPNVMMGYAESRADLSKGDELGGQLATGDLAHLDEDGFVYIAGRAKRDAKIFGLRLNLDDIEDLLRSYGPSAVVAKAEKLIIFCEYGDEEQYRTYRRELSTKLKIHHQAFEFRRVQQLPLSSSGKIDYKTLLSTV